MAHEPARAPSSAGDLYCRKCHRRARLTDSFLPRASMGANISRPPSGVLLLVALHVWCPALPPLGRDERGGSSRQRGASRSYRVAVCGAHRRLPSNRPPRVMVSHLADPNPRLRLVRARDSELSGGLGALG